MTDIYRLGIELSTGPTSGAALTTNAWGAVLEALELAAARNDWQYDYPASDEGTTMAILARGVIEALGGVLLALECCNCYNEETVTARDATARGWHVIEGGYNCETCIAIELEDEESERD
jgi:hypothetical protein